MRATWECCYSWLDQEWTPRWRTANYLAWRDDLNQKDLFFGDFALGTRKECIRGLKGSVHCITQRNVGEEARSKEGHSYERQREDRVTVLCWWRSKIFQRSWPPQGLSRSLSLVPVQLLRLSAHTLSPSLTHYHLKEPQFLVRQEACSALLGITHHFHLCQPTWLAKMDLSNFVKCLYVLNKTKFEHLGNTCFWV